MNEAVNAMFAAISSALGINKIKAYYRDMFCDADFTLRVAKLAAFHDLSHLLYYSLLEEKIITEEKGERFLTANKYVMQAVYRYERLEAVCRDIYSLFEDNKISFIPLKGAVLRDYYREPWLRTSCDADILVKREDVDRAVKLLRENLGGRAEWSGDHDIPVYFGDDIHIELHFSFDGLSVKGEEIMSGVWESAVKVKGFNYRYKMRGDIFYYYHIAHMAKHIKHGGCGVRPFIDLYFLDKIEIEGREETLKKGGLLKFSKTASALANEWLSGETPSEELRPLARFILRGGAYGTDKTRAEQTNKVIESGSLKRVFLPYSELKYHYKVLEKHRWLYPVCAVRRVGRLLGSTLPKALKNRGEKADTAAKEKTAEMMEQIGL